MSKIYFGLNKNSREFNGLDDKAKVLVESGVEAVRKYAAEKANTAKKKNFMALLSGVDSSDRKSFNDSVVEKIAKYSAEKAGIDVSNFELKCVADPSVNKRTVFRETFNLILAQIMSPIVPAMVSAEFMDFADVANIAWGDTARFKVNSNDVFFVHRQAEGVLQGSVQRLYNDELTVNPEPYSIKTTVDWYQVAAGQFDIGEFVFKVGYSFNAYITQMIVAAITANITAGTPSAYFVNGFSTLTFTRLAEILRAANGGAKVHAFGTLAALSNIRPEGAANGVANMQMQLGEEWSKTGYVGTYMDVDLIRIPQILLPNTVNVAPLVGIPDSTVYMFADGGYKPVKLVFEGSAVTIDVIPTESPDKEMGIQVTSRFGHTFVAASKYGAITGLNAG